MKLLTNEIHERLLKNGILRRQMEKANPECDLDLLPVVKLFTPDANCTWLLTDIDPEKPDFAFGLCDLGMGCPELGYVSLSELADLRGRLGLPVERDLHFAPAKSISAYTDEARAAGGIRA